MQDENNYAVLQVGGYIKHTDDLIEIHTGIPLMVGGNLKLWTFKTGDELVISDGGMTFKKFFDHGIDFNSEKIRNILNFYKVNVTNGEFHIQVKVKDGSDGINRIIGAILTIQGLI